jgi:hypothetical protein
LGASHSCGCTAVWTVRSCWRTNVVNLYVGEVDVPACWGIRGGSRFTRRAGPVQRCPQWREQYWPGCVVAGGTSLASGDLVQTAVQLTRKIDACADGTGLHTTVVLMATSISHSNERATEMCCRPKHPTADRPYQPCSVFGRLGSFCSAAITVFWPRSRLPALRYAIPRWNCRRGVGSLATAVFK